MKEGRILRAHIKKGEYLKLMINIVFQWDIRKVFSFVYTRFIDADNTQDEVVPQGAPKHIITINCHVITNEKVI